MVDPPVGSLPPLTIPPSCFPPVAWSSAFLLKSPASPQLSVSQLGMTLALLFKSCHLRRCIHLVFLTGLFHPRGQGFCLLLLSIPTTCSWYIITHTHSRKHWQEHHPAQANWEMPNSWAITSLSTTDTQKECIWKNQDRGPSQQHRRWACPVAWELPVQLEHNSPHHLRALEPDPPHDSSPALLGGTCQEPQEELFPWQRERKPGHGEEFVWKEPVDLK